MNRRDYENQELPSYIPRNPAVIYKESWAGWAHYLHCPGNGEVDMDDVSTVYAALTPALDPDGEGLGLSAIELQFDETYELVGGVRRLDAPNISKMDDFAREDHARALLWVLEETAIDRENLWWERALTLKILESLGMTFFMSPEGDGFPLEYAGGTLLLNSVDAFAVETIMVQNATDKTGSITDESEPSERGNC